MASTGICTARSVSINTNCTVKEDDADKCTKCVANDTKFVNSSGACVLRVDSKAKCVASKYTPKVDSCDECLDPDAFYWKAADKACTARVDSKYACKAGQYKHATD